MHLSAVTKIWPVSLCFWVCISLTSFLLRHLVSHGSIELADAAPFFLAAEVSIAIASGCLLYFNAYRHPGLAAIYVWLWLSPLVIVMPYATSIGWLMQLPEQQMQIMGCSLLLNLSIFGSFWTMTYYLWRRNQFLNPPPEYKEEQGACAAWMARISTEQNKSTLEELMIEGKKRWPQWRHQIQGEYQSRKYKLNQGK